MTVMACNAEKIFIDIHTHVITMDNIPSSL